MSHLSINPKSTLGPNFTPQRLQLSKLHFLNLHSYQNQADLHVVCAKIIPPIVAMAEVGPLYNKEHTN